MQYTICLLVVLVFSIVADKNNNRFFLFLSALVLSLFCGLRGASIGVDTINYIRFFSYIRASGFAFGSDIGFSVFSYFLMGIVNNPYYPLLIISFITNYLIVYRLWDFRDEASFPLMVLIYMTVYYPYCFNIIRQMLAISIVFWATKYLKRKQYYIYLVFLALASSLHTSALIGFSLMLFRFGYQTEYSNKRLLWIALMFVFLAIGINVFSANIIKYEKNIVLSNNGIHEMTIFKAILLFVVFFSNKVYSNEKFSLSQQGEEIPMQSYIPYIYGTGLLLALSGMIVTFMNRVGFLFLMFEMPFWGQTVRVIKNRIVYRIAILVIIVYALAISYLSGDNKDSLYFYSSFLNT